MRQMINGEWQMSVLKLTEGFAFSETLGIQSDICNLSFKNYFSPLYT